MASMTARRRIVRISSAGNVEQLDDLVAESPLAIVVNDALLSTTMRTPGHDFELVAGWLVAECGVRQASDIRQMKALNPAADDDETVDSVVVTLEHHLQVPSARVTLTSSSCGFCGTTSLSPLHVHSRHEDHGEWWVSTAQLLAMPKVMRVEQRAFSRTGGHHAAALISDDGNLEVCREDIGRHNAVDKVIGWGLLSDRLPLSRNLVVVSSRVSFEIVQKAAAAGLRGVVAVSAASDMAVDLARAQGMLLVGMCRESSLNIYSRQDLVLIDGE
jgi:FdhD protein